MIRTLRRINAPLRISVFKLPHANLLLLFIYCKSLGPLLTFFSSLIQSSFMSFDICIPETHLIPTPPTEPHWKYLLEPKDNTMRVFLIQTAKGLFSSSGGYKANNALLRYLASRGHCVRQLCYSYRVEVESYMDSSGDVDMQFRTRVLHMRSDSDKPGQDVQVHELCMEDGVETLALDSEGFDAAFGGRVESPNQLARMTADYIEVNKRASHSSIQHY